MLTYNTMRFGTDTFNIIEDSRTALLVAKNPIVSDFEYNYVDKFIINYDQPIDTDIRFAFYLPSSQGKTMCRINPSTGSLIVLNPDQGWVFEPNVDDVLNYGHSIDALLAMTDFSFSKALYPVIALKTTKSAVPKVKLAVQVSKRTTELDRDHVVTYNFDEPRRFLNLTFEKEITGSADATISAACKTSADGDYGDYGELDSVLDKEVYGVQFKWQRHVDSVGDADKVVSKVNWRATRDVKWHAFGDFADIYSVTKNYYLPLKHCVVVVKHSDLSGGAKIKAYAKLDPSINWKVYTIGTGTGSNHTYDLPVSKFIDVNNLHVYVNGTETTDYQLWVKDGTITINAPEGATITASSNYNLKTEEWLELDADATERDISDGKFTTRFYSKITKSGVYVSAIRLRLFRASKNPDTVITLPITPTGEEQSYTLPANVELVYFRVLDSNGNILFDGGAHQDLDCECEFNPSSHKITFTVPQGDYTIEVDYRKLAPVPTVYSWTAGFCV